ncbi:MAG: DUF58 domain-containing protein [Rhodanobacteraceae bacterium]
MISTGTQKRPEPPSADGLAHPSLDELLALRHQVPRMRAGLGARSAPAGQHLSHLHARGVDYAESRIYQPGDDIRVMDWRVTARTGKPHTKLFLEERERDLLVLLDLNSGMRFGTRKRFKSVQAIRAAALAAWTSAAVGDRAGALVFGPQSSWIRPRAGTRGVLALLRDMLRVDATASDSSDVRVLSSALDQASRCLHSGSRIVLISDGFSCDADAQARLARMRQKADVAILGVADPLEMQTPSVRTLAVESEGQRVQLQLDDHESRNAFQAAMRRGRRQLDQCARQCGIRPVWIDTTSDLHLVMRQLLLETLGGRR